MNHERKRKKAIQIFEHYYYRKHNYPKALKQFRRLVRLEPHIAQRETYLHCVALCYYNLWDYEKALDTTNLALMYSPYAHANIEDKRDILSAMGRQDEADECSRQLVDVFNKQKLDAKFAQYREWMY